MSEWVCVINKVVRCNGNEYMHIMYYSTGNLTALTQLLILIVKAV